MRQKFRRDGIEKRGNDLLQESFLPHKGNRLTEMSKGGGREWAGGLF